jgi:hypothetical protein
VSTLQEIGTVSIEGRMPGKHQKFARAWNTSGISRVLIGAGPLFSPSERCSEGLARSRDDLHIGIMGASRSAIEAT